MTQEELLKSRAYNISMVAGEYYSNNPNADSMTAFEEGAKWADKNQKDGLISIDKVCEYLESLTYQDYAGAPLERYVPDYIIDNLRKAMEE